MLIRQHAKTFLHMTLFNPQKSPEKSALFQPHFTDENTKVQSWGLPGKWESWDAGQAEVPTCSDI